MLLYRPYIVLLTQASGKPQVINESVSTFFSSSELTENVRVKLLQMACPNFLKHRHLWVLSLPPLVGRSPAVWWGGPGGWNVPSAVLGILYTLGTCYELTMLLRPAHRMRRVLHPVTGRSLLDLFHPSTIPGMAIPSRTLTFLLQVPSTHDLKRRKRSIVPLNFNVAPRSSFGIDRKKFFS